MSGLRALLWIAVSLLGAWALGTIALSRGETLSSAWFLIAAVCIYALGYRFYSRFLAVSVFGLDANRATPATRLAARMMPVIIAGRAAGTRTFRIVCQ